MNMKLISILFIYSFLVFNARAQVLINQITTDGMGDYTTAQSLQINPLFVSSISQIGNNNSVKLSQTIEGDIYSFPNSANSFQQGDFNLAEITQRGNENVLLSFQLGYLISGLFSTSNNQLEAPSQNMLSFSATTNNQFATGKNNTLYSVQEGKSNNILAIQQGDDNYIDVEQSGNDNILIARQVGNSNKVEDFKQNSIDGSFDVITQLGDNNTLNFLNESTGVLAENAYSQEGTNLSLTISNNTFSAPGGIIVNQTGRDMKIIIDQSYFSFPIQ